MRRMMMPPPPPFVVPKNDVQVFVQVDPRVKAVESALQRQMAKARMLSAVADLKADIALTEMRQERYTLERKAKDMKPVQVVIPEKDELMAEFRKIVSLMNSRTTVIRTAVPVIASLGGKRCHRPDCTVVARVPKDKRVSFDSVEEAAKHGYDACGKCFMKSDGTFLASKDQNKVHLRSCPAISNISLSNMVPLDSAKEAFDLGFAPCKLCMVHSSENHESSVEVNNESVADLDMHHSIMQIA